jgi:hypothetical protein
MEKEYKNKLNNKETQIIQLQTKIDLLTGSKKAISPPDIKKVFISNSSKGKQNINYNNYDFYNNKYIKKDKNQTLDYISQFAKNKTINILNSNISIKTIKNYHPDNANMNNNINENNNQIMLYKYPINNHKYDNTKKDKLDKNNSAPNIHLYNLDINSNNVRKKFFLNNNKINKYKKPNINLKEQKIILKENEDKNIIEMKERTINSKNNYKKIKLPFYIVNNNKNFEEKLKMNLNTNNINDNLINKIKQKNIDEYNKYINLKLDEMENFNKLKANRKKKIKSCESRKSISPKKKLQKKFNKIMSSTTIEKDLYRNNSAFNIIFKNINNEKGEKYSQLKNMILNNNKNEFNNNNILNNQRDKSHINNSRKINLNNNNGKIYLESYSKVLNKNII